MEEGKRVWDFALLAAGSRIEFGILGMDKYYKYKSPNL
jgi:hypothetical protein